MNVAPKLSTSLRKLYTAPFDVGVFATQDWKETIAISFLAAFWGEEWRYFFYFFTGLSVLGLLRIGALILLLTSTTLWSSIAYYVASELIRRDVMLSHHLPQSVDLIFAIAAASVVLLVRLRTYDLPLAEWGIDPQRALCVAEIFFWAFATIPEVKNRTVKAEPQVTGPESDGETAEESKVSPTRWQRYRATLTSIRASMRRGIKLAPSPATVEEALRTLEIAPGSSAAVVKRKYRELMMEYHPDRLSNLSESSRKRAMARCIDVSLAYRTLARRRFST